MLSVSLQRKYNFYHQNTLIDAFRTNFRNIIGRNPSMATPWLANQDLTPMLCSTHLGLLIQKFKNRKPATIIRTILELHSCFQYLPLGWKRSTFHCIFTFSSSRFALNMKEEIILEVTLRLMIFTLKILVCYI